MTEAGSNHWQIVSRSLTGERATDEQTLASLAILGERLNRLKKLDGLFANIEFSQDVEKLKGHKSAVPVA